MVSISLRKLLSASLVILFNRCFLCYSDLQINDQSVFEKFTWKHVNSIQADNDKLKHQVNSALLVESPDDLRWVLLSIVSTFSNLCFDHSIYAEHVEDDCLLNLKNFIQKPEFMEIWKRVIVPRAVMALSNYIRARVDFPFKMAKMVPILRSVKLSELIELFDLSIQEETLFIAVLHGNCENTTAETT